MVYSDTFANKQNIRTARAIGKKHLQYEYKKDLGRTAVILSTQKTNSDKIWLEFVIFIEEDGEIDAPLVMRICNRKKEVRPTGIEFIISRDVRKSVTISESDFTEQKAIHKSGLIREDIIVEVPFDFLEGIRGAKTAVLRGGEKEKLLLIRVDKKITAMSNVIDHFKKKQVSQEN